MHTRLTVLVVLEALVGVQRVLVRVEGGVVDKRAVARGAERNGLIANHTRGRSGGRVDNDHVDHGEVWRVNSECARISCRKGEEERDYVIIGRARRQEGEQMRFSAVTDALLTVPTIEHSHSDRCCSPLPAPCPASLPAYQATRCFRSPVPMGSPEELSLDA